MYVLYIHFSTKNRLQPKLIDIQPSELLEFFDRVKQILSRWSHYCIRGSDTPYVPLFIANIGRSSVLGKVVGEQAFPTFWRWQELNPFR